MARVKVPIRAMRAGSEVGVYETGGVAIDLVGVGNRFERERSETRAGVEMVDFAGLRNGFEWLERATK